MFWCNAFYTVFKRGSWMTMGGGVLGCFFFWNDILVRSCLKTHRFWVHNPRSINKMHHCCRRECKGSYMSKLLEVSSGQNVFLISVSLGAWLMRKNGNPCFPAGTMIVLGT